jgi:hypothetical protein
MRSAASAGTAHARRMSEARERVPGARDSEAKSRASAETAGDTRLRRLKGGNAASYASPAASCDESTMGPRIGVNASPGVWADAVDVLPLRTVLAAPA